MNVSVLSVVGKKGWRYIMLLLKYWFKVFVVVICFLMTLVVMVVLCEVDFV